MQRMKLHLSGVKLPRLGSLQDRMYRSYMLKDSQLEAKKTELLMLLTLTNPEFDKAHKQRDWSNAVRDIWKEYLGCLFNVEMPKHSKEEAEMLEYYQKVVRKVKPKMQRDKKTGKLKVTDIDTL